MAAEQVELVQPDGPGVEEVVADKGYHSDETVALILPGRPSPGRGPLGAAAPARGLHTSYPARTGCEPAAPEGGVR